MRRVRTNCRRFAVAVAISACVPSAGYVLAQETVAPQNATNQTDPADEVAHDDHHSPQLGVLVGSSPGEGVCVIDTLRGGPADRVGVQPGDYILAVNDQTVSNPQELKEKIASLQSDDTIDLNIWRRGKYVNKEVRLAKASTKLPESHRGWLGVVLAPPTEGSEGATIREVAADSPAEKAGLRRGDEIVQLNGNRVQSLQQFVNDVSDFEPGNEIKLVVNRDGNEQEITAELGQVVEAPVQWFRNQMPQLGEFPDDFMSSMRSPSGPPIIEEMIDDMRRQIRVLRQEVDELKAAVPPAEKTEKATPPDDDVSLHSKEPDASRQQGLLQHIPSNENLREHLVLAQLHGNFQPNISNDWSGARYTSPAYQGWRDSQARPSRGTGGRYIYPYNYGYGNYGYGYNGYNNYRYYQNGGRPYYYGGGYPYGYRGGVGFGTGMGVYW